MNRQYTAPARDPITIVRQPAETPKFLTFTMGIGCTTRSPAFPTCNYSRRTAYHPNAGHRSQRPNHFPCVSVDRTIQGLNPMSIRLAFTTAMMIFVCTLTTQRSHAAPPQLDTPEARQAAVERSLLAETWVEGHAFGLRERMGILDVPGISVAVIRNGQLDWAAGYGVRDEVSGQPVTAETLFQAASISKPVAALATLRLAQEGIIDLDAPIQDFLVSFELPESSFKGTVTPRTVLNHTAGLNVSGFPGYQIDEPIPTAVELLEGKGNTDALARIEHVNSRFRYSGGGSTMLQVALSDATGLDFNSIMQSRVLTPLGMTQSTYEQPLPIESWPNHSAAHDYSGRRIVGGFHVYPEQFPAGLWTTPSDLTKFVLEVQALAAGHDGKVLNAEMGKEMLSPVFGRVGLGLFINEYDGQPWFGHSGSNFGIKCDFRASFSGGNGVIVMTNGDTGYELCQDVIRAVAKVYQWPGMIPEPVKEVPMAPDELRQYAGDYAYGPDEVAFISFDEERLMVQQLPYPQMPLAPIGNQRFQIVGTEYHVDFSDLESGTPQSMSMSFAPDQHAKRVETDDAWPVQDLLHENTAEAVRRYLQMHEADPNDPVVGRARLTQMAMSIQMYNQPETAQALSECITAMYPTDALAWDALGQTHFQRGATQQAIDAYEACLRLIPEDTSLTEADRDQLQSRAIARLHWLRAGHP
ncbi:MAG: hypothetical protein CMJ35_00465 [Phycisphaerae bacterium]|nr:hypothetical protein [Phycisphaerae bacterium]